MLGSISKSRRTSRLLCAAVAAAGVDLLAGGNAGATTQPTITDCELIQVSIYSAYSDNTLYAHFYVQWDGTGQSGNTMYFYRGLNSTSPISTIALTDMGNVNPSSAWETCGVVVNDVYNSGTHQHTFSAHTQTGASTSDWFYWRDADTNNAGPDLLTRPDVYDSDTTYQIGVQAYDGTNWSYVSWAQAVDNT